MIKIKKIELENFRSWKKGIIDLSENNIYAFVGKNGSGKSSIRMGLQYALSGNLPKLNVKDITNNKSKNFKVKVDFIYNNKETSIIREGKKTKITIENQEKSIRDLSFLDTIKEASRFTFLTTETSQFLELTENKRKEILSSIIPDIHFFRDVCSKFTKNVINKFNDKETIFVNKLDVLEVKKQEINKQLHILNNTLQYEIENKNKLLNMIKQYNNISSENVEKIKQTKKEKEEKAKSLYNKIKKNNEQISKLQSKLDVLENKIQHYKYNQEEIQTARLNIKKYEEIIKKSSITCPNCKTEIVFSQNTKNDAEKKIEQLNKKILKIQQENIDINKILNEKQKINNNLVNIKKENNKIMQEINRIKLEIQEINNKIQELNKLKIEVEQTNIKAIESRIKKIEREINETKNNITHIDRQKHKINKKINCIKNKTKIYSDILNIFKNTLPAVYFQEFLKQYCKSVKLFADILNIKIDFINKEDKIIILVNNKKYNALSTGEQQRAKIATTLGFSILYNNFIDVLILDEVFDLGLDESGIISLCNIIKNILTKRYNKIILITHNTQILENMENIKIIRINKNEYSYIENINS